MVDRTHGTSYPGLMRDVAVDRTSARRCLDPRDVSRLLIAASAIRVCQGSCVDVERELREAAEAVETAIGRSILAAMAAWMACEARALPEPRPAHRELAKRILLAAHVPLDATSRSPSGGG